MTARTTMQIPGFRGDVIAPDHPDYDDARAVWNGTVDRRPRLIARCSGTADVAAAVRFARDRDLEIAVRGGGHNVAGTAVCDDGIVIDLSAMRAVSVDPVERTAHVQGGALWGDVDHETQAHGLATTGGIVGHTGVGGLSLGGGIGWLMRKHGLTVDNLVEAEVVTAEGDIVRASANDHPDLFWALRGGGGNFGVVSSFRFALHPVGPTVMAGPVFWAAEDTTDVLRFYREFVADAPDELGTVIRLGTIPPLPVIDEELHFRPAIAVASCYAGPVEDGERAVRALRQFGTPLVDLVGPTLYVDHQSGIDDTVPHGWHYYWKATNLTGLSDEVIDIVAEHAYRASSPRSYAAMFHMGGAVARVPRDATAYPGRDVEHNIIIDAAWLPDQDDTVGAAETAWATGLPRRPPTPPRRRLRELPRLRRRHEPRPRGLRRRHLPAARRDQGEVRPRERVPQQQEHPARHAGALSAHRIDSRHLPETRPRKAARTTGSAKNAAALIDSSREATSRAERPGMCSVTAMRLAQHRAIPDTPRPKYCSAGLLAVWRRADPSHPIARWMSSPATAPDGDSPAFPLVRAYMEPPAGIEPATPSLPWNHQEPLCEPPFPQVTPDRKGRSYRFPSAELCVHSRQESSEQSGHCRAFRNPGTRSW